jgi:hypothetical protein
MTFDQKRGLHDLPSDDRHDPTDPEGDLMTIAAGDPPQGAESDWCAWFWWAEIWRFAAAPWGAVGREVLVMSVDETAAWAREELAGLVEVPEYGSAAWLRLAPGDPRQQAALVVAAERWREGQGAGR